MDKEDFEALQEMVPYSEWELKQHKPEERVLNYTNRCLHCGYINAQDYVNIREMFSAGTIN